MAAISGDTAVEELAAIISQASEAAGIIATLSGGSAVSVYTDNAYQSHDLDFVTAAEHSALRDALAPFGFKESRSKRQLQHPETSWLVEFPPAPLGFGDMCVDHNDISILSTTYGPLRIITPTLSVLDRLAAYRYHNDLQCWDQAVMVCRSQDVDWDAIYAWADAEGWERDEVDRLRLRAGNRANAG